MYRALRRFGKGFLVGYVGKLLFGVLSALLRSRGRPAAFWQYCRPLFRRSDVLGYGLFLGGFLAAFESLMRWMKQHKETFKSRRLRSDHSTQHSTAQHSPAVSRALHSL